ncbi:hypothetical protein G4B88_027020 [Cannabis sativa]|uniref:DDRGK domain-containing protein 1 n=1 Tax=Cannabis sativa TaxID=3483 RepID=A0A7J6E9J4_CANSA|nr:hypothetical protein G4B88_028208 [Cannabis sativa]KAF4357843.1 hypothetical protein G4B88_027020 [Cannabis sativa]
MEETLAIILSMLLLAALVPLYLWKRRQDSQSTHEHDEPPQARQSETVVRSTATRRMRRRPASGASSSSAPASHAESVDESDDEAAAARESRQTKQDSYNDLRKRKEEEREAEERRMEEEALAQKAKEEEAAAMEFEKWKGEFSIDAEGTTENEVQGGSQDLLSDFVEYIKKQKCVPLEDLAAEFKLRTQECINRIASLESIGRLSGIMDDRGKYIYISQEEMQAVAEYIKHQGRVSISHLASKSNQFIDLESKPHLADELISTEEIIVS